MEPWIRKAAHEQYLAFGKWFTKLLNFEKEIPSCETMHKELCEIIERNYEKAKLSIKPKFPFDPYDKSDKEKAEAIFGVFAEFVCPNCGGPLLDSHGHGRYCPKDTCKWGWECEMNGSPLKPPRVEEDDGVDEQIWLPGGHNYTTDKRRK